MGGMIAFIRILPYIRLAEGSLVVGISIRIPIRVVARLIVIFLATTGIRLLACARVRFVIHRLSLAKREYDEVSRNGHKQSEHAQGNVI